MRRFSPKEKEYIDILCKKTEVIGTSYLAINMIESEVLKTAHVGYTTDTDYLVFYREVDADPTEVIAVENKIMEVAILLEYLEENGLIMYVQDKSTVNKDEQSYFGFDNKYGQLTPRKKGVDDVIVEQLTKASKYRIYVGETLRKYVEEGFETIEEQQLDEARIQSKTAIKSLKEAKKQTWWSIGALIVAVVTMFVTIAVQVCYTQSVRVEEVKSPVIQTIKKEILPKQETDKRALPAVRQKKRDNAKPVSGNKNETVEITIKNRI